MCILRAACETLEVLERAPILDHADAPPVNERLCTKEALLRVSEERAEHGPHCPCCRDPLAKSEELVDAHADKEDDKGLVGLCRESARNHLCHVVLPLISMTPCTRRRQAYLVARSWRACQESCWWHIFAAHPAEAGI